MQINLKQTEIIAALKQYIAGQGISLQGKSVDMAFTAGRKEAGISVEISIEDVTLPDFGLPDETTASPTPKLTPVADAVDTATASLAPKTELVEEPVAEAQAANVTEEAEQEETATAPAAPVSRLFS